MSFHGHVITALMYMSLQQQVCLHTHIYKLLLFFCIFKLVFIYVSIHDTTCNWIFERLNTHCGSLLSFNVCTMQRPSITTLNIT